MNAARVGMSLLAFLVTAAGLPCAIAADGLTVRDQSVWPRWQARLGVTSGAIAEDHAPLVGAQLLGDYYFDFARARLRLSGLSGGLRATSGLLAGSGRSTLGLSMLPAAPGAALSVTARSTLASEIGSELSALPYLGLGYTGLSARGGWGFTADIGVLAGGQGLRLARPGRGVDDILRELKLTPVLQLGVSYSF